MANDISSKVILGIDTNEFRRGIAKVDNSIKGISKQFQNLGGLIGASFAVSKLQEFTMEASRLGGELVQVGEGFKRFGTSADLDSLRKSTRGLVTDLELMKTAVTAGNFGIPVQQLGSLLDFASRRAQETGQSVDYLVNSIVTGIGRKSPLILDNLGISAVRLKEQFGGAALEAQNIGDVAAAVGRIATEELSKMGEPVDTVATDLQRLAVEFENFKAIFGVAVNPALLAALKAIQGAALAVYQVGQGNYIQAFMGLATGDLPSEPASMGTGGQFPGLPENLQVGQQGIFQAFPIEPNAVKSSKELSDEFKKQKQEADDLRKYYEALNGEIYRMIGLQEQQAEGERKVFRDDLVAGYVPLILEAVDMTEGELVPILETVREKFDNVNLVAQQFGTILSSSFGAAIESGEDFFEVIGRALKAYVQQLIAATAATVALAAISSAFGGGTFLTAFSKVGQGTGLAGFFGGDKEFTGRVKGFELFLQQQRTNRNIEIINGG